MTRFLRIAFALALVGGAGNAIAGLKVAGASTLLPLAREAAQQLKQDAALDADIRGGGSETAIRAAMSGQVDIAMVARALSAEEARGLRGHPIGLDGVAVIVNARNPLAAVTHDQVRGLFSGRLAQWRELGLPAAMGAIVPVIKAPGHATRLIFDAHFSVGALLPPRAVELGSNLAVLLYVSIDPGAVGYVSIGALEEARRRGLSVKGVALDGVEARVEHCTARRYPLCRPLQLVTRGAARGDARRFIEFFASRDGRAIVAHHGFALPPGTAP